MGRNIQQFNLLYSKPRSSEVKELQYPLLLCNLHSILLLTSEEPIQCKTSLVASGVAKVAISVRSKCTLSKGIHMPLILP